MHWSAYDVAAALSRGGKGKSRKKGKGWMACCPSHADETPSLSLQDGRAGLLWHCHSGCSQDEVLKALSDFLGTGERVERSARKPKTIVENTFELHIPTQDQVDSIKFSNFTHGVLGQPRKVWTYRTAAGVPALYVGRYKSKDDPDSKEIVPWSWQRCNGEEPRLTMRNWEENRPLYNLVELTERPDAPVLYVEGEKAADAARKLFPRFVVTTHAGGGCSFGKTDLTPLTGRLVVIQPDFDAPGQKMAEGLWIALQGIAKRCTIMDWPVLWPDGSNYERNKGDDCADHLKAGWTHEKLLASKDAGHISFYEPDPVKQFGEGTPGPMWGYVTLSGDQVTVHFRERSVATCSAVAWRNAASMVEQELNGRIKRHSPRCEDGRFPRRNGTVAVPFAFIGEVYSLVEMLGRGGDVDACKMQWCSMPPYLRTSAFRMLESQIKREMRAMELSHAA